MTSHEKDFMESVMAHINSSFLFFLFFYSQWFWNLLIAQSSAVRSQPKEFSKSRQLNVLYSVGQAKTSQCVGGKFLESPDNRTVQTFQKPEPQGISLQELLLLKVENN